MKMASKSWRGKIESHETFSHDSLDSLGYDWERIGNPKIGPKFPLKVYMPRTPEDVAKAVKERKTLGQELKVRSKGHSSNDLVLAEGGAVLLMQGMDQIIDVDEEGLTATVQGGAISALIDDHLAPLGLGLPVIGDHRDITVGGFASVGGISPASHRFGMFIDNVLAMQFVDWDGEIKRCQPDRELRGLLQPARRPRPPRRHHRGDAAPDPDRQVLARSGTTTRTTTARWTSSSRARSRSSKSPAT